MVLPFEVQDRFCPIAAVAAGTAVVAAAVVDDPPKSGLSGLLSIAAVATGAYFVVKDIVRIVIPGPRF